MPRDRNDPLAKQNTKDRFYGTNDPVAAKMIWKKKQIAEQKKANANANSNDNGEGDERAVATCYVRFDTRDESTQHIVISEQDLRDQFYSHGEIVSVRMHQNSGAFIEYTTGDATELAIMTMNHKLINGRKILVNWARQPKRGNVDTGGPSSSSNSSSVQGPILPKAPPGTSLSSSLSNTTCLPAGFAPSAQVAAAAKARAMANSGLAKTGLTSTSMSNSKSNSSLPRPGGGGGPIRRIGAVGMRGRAVPAPKPYYPSADPGRLGTLAQKD